jgi:hypothetical protein
LSSPNRARVAQAIGRAYKEPAIRLFADRMNSFRSALEIQPCLFELARNDVGPYSPPVQRVKRPVVGGVKRLRLGL